MTTPFTHIQRALYSVQLANRARFHVPGHMGGPKAPYFYELMSETATSINPGVSALDIKSSLLDTPSPSIIGSELYPVDVTELDEMDVISHPTGCLKHSQDDWAQALGGVATFYLTSGSTIGLQAALLAICGPQDHVLLARNTHQSIIHGLIITGATPHWILPEHHPTFGTWAQLSPDTLEQSLNQASHPIKAVVITSPTYEGVGSDIRALAGLCRRYGCLCIVDEAHGALWPYSPQLPTTAIDAGADIVVQSLHKTAGALTPAALAHLPHESRVSPQGFQEALNLLQSTSPSWPLLANIEATGALLTSTTGQQRLHQLLSQVQQLRQTLPPGVHACEGPTQDPLALLLRFDSPDSGEEMAVYFEETHQIAFESYTDKAVLYKIGLGAKTADLQQLYQALNHWSSQHKHSDTLDHGMVSTTNQLKSQINTQTRRQLQTFHTPMMVCPPRQAYFAAKQQVIKHNAIGRVSGQTWMTCPPGIPVLFPGEQIQEDHLPYLPDSIWVLESPTIHP